MKIPTEYTIAIPQHLGSSGRFVRLIQEWLCLYGFHTRIDGQFGPATQASVRKFQAKNRISGNGTVDELTYRALISPITRVCRMLNSTAESFSSLVLAAGRQHLRENPREIGGQNCGPWVRLYTSGKEGKDYPWCAGFVSTLLRQAGEIKRSESKLKSTLSCDNLVAQAKEADIFVNGRDVESGMFQETSLPAGTIFILRNPRNAKDWVHTGIVSAFHGEYVETIEGNTNDSGDREGYEVCKRSRTYSNMDFIVVR
jgi:hypothetical protein